jgi:hypothetical protein
MHYSLKINSAVEILGIGNLKTGYQGEIHTQESTAMSPRMNEPVGRTPESRQPAGHRLTVRAAVPDSGPFG